MGESGATLNTAGWETRSRPVAHQDQTHKRRSDPELGSCLRLF